jgi:DNA-binding response OmpR family regulator
MVPANRRRYLGRVPSVLVAADAPSIHEEVRAVLTGRDVDVRELGSGREVLSAVAENPPDLVVLDLQIGSMGGMASCLEIRLEEHSGRLNHVPVLMLLDRRADVFLARRAEADGWLVKPLDPLRLRKAVNELLAGRTYFDESYRPVDVPTGAEAADG